MDANTRLTKLEDKLDIVETKLNVMHSDLIEIKIGIKFANALAKAIGAITALVLTYFTIR